MIASLILLTTNQAVHGNSGKSETFTRNKTAVEVCKWFTIIGKIRSGTFELVEQQMKMKEEKNFAKESWA